MGIKYNIKRLFCTRYTMPKNVYYRVTFMGEYGIGRIIGKSSIKGLHIS